MSSCLCEPMETAQSLLAMTHMRWLHGQSGHESTGYTQSVVQCVGGLRPWPMDIYAKTTEGRARRRQY